MEKVGVSPINWASDSNELRLNPRLSDSVRSSFERAWALHVEAAGLRASVGIATSGSSGEASIGKLIVLSKRAFLVAADGSNRHFGGARADDVWLKMLPSFHVGGLAIYARAHLSGARVFESRGEKWDAGSFVHEVEVSHATMISLVPTQLFDVLSLGVQCPSHVRAVIIGGGRLSPELRLRALELGWPVHVSYGFTECCSQVATALKPEDERMMPLSHVSVRLGADDRLEVRSEALLTGLIRFYSSGESSFVDPKSSDGWFTTEDRGSVNADGSLAILGRTQDFVKVGGEGVSMSRLESALESLRGGWPAGVDAAVLAAEDARLGAMIVLLVSGADSGAAREIETRFNALVMPYERVRELHAVDKIPRSDLGKLLRGQALNMVGRKLASS